MYFENEGNNPRNTENITNNMNSPYRSNKQTSNITTVENCASSVQHETTITEGKHEKDFNNNIKPTITTTISATPTTPVARYTGRKNKMKKWKFKGT